MTTAATSVTKVLTRYFNEGAGKRPARVWLEELKSLSADEKYSLAMGVCAITGDTLED